jgi:guanine deaminase
MNSKTILSSIRVTLSKSAFVFISLILTQHIAFADLRYVRGKVLHFLRTPQAVENTLKEGLDYQWIEDGVLEIQDGKIASTGPWKQYEKKLKKGTKVDHYKNGVIVPGFIDSHVHFPQTTMIAAPGGDLFQWLTLYTFPFEKRLSDKTYADKTAEAFIHELLKNGTTSAMAFATIYPQAVDALFEAAEKRKMRLITGKVVGDRNLPDFLIETPDQAYQASKELIKKWHQKPGTRLLYSISPRFVPTTTEAMFEKMGALKKEFPDTHVHTHISETVRDVEWSKELSGRELYLDSYEKHGLIGKGTLLAHGVYLKDQEMKRMSETNTGVAFCPTSNLFLGSGLFNLQKAEAHGMRVGMGTDVGAGTSFSMLQTLNEAYKVLQLQKQDMTALKGLYLATLGSAQALGIDQFVGNFTPGKEADFVVLDFEGATPLMQRRMEFSRSLEERLFGLMILGDDRSVLATYIAGEIQYLAPKQ